MVARGGKASGEATGMGLNQNSVHWGGGEEGQTERNLRQKMTGLGDILSMGWFSGFWLLQEGVDGGVTHCDE